MAPRKFKKNFIRKQPLHCRCKYNNNKTTPQRPKSMCFTHCSQSRPHKGLHSL